MTCRGSHIPNSGGLIGVPAETMLPLGRATLARAQAPEARAVRGREAQAHPSGPQAVPSANVATDPSSEALSSAPRRTCTGYAPEMA